MSFVGYKTDFLKMLFAGNELQLPVKGSHVFKKDNPLIISAANHSLHSIVSQKLANSCTCPHSRTDLEIPNYCSTGLCNTSPYFALVESFYTTMCARIFEYHITRPLFTKDSFDQDLHLYASAALYQTTSFTQVPKDSLLELGTFFSSPPSHLPSLIVPLSRHHLSNIA